MLAQVTDAPAKLDTLATLEECSSIIEREIMSRENDGLAVWMLEEARSALSVAIIDVEDLTH